MYSQSVCRCRGPPYGKSLLGIFEFALCEASGLGENGRSLCNKVVMGFVLDLVRGMETWHAQVGKVSKRASNRLART